MTAAQHAGVNRSAAQVFAEGTEITDPALARTMQRLAPVLREAVHYHYGWIGKDGGPAGGERGGSGRKAVVFALLCAGVDGGPVERGLPGVVAGNLVVNAACIHDDIMDREILRRGRPTLWQAYGHDRALVAGDALIGLAFASLSEHQHRRARDAVQVMGAFWNRTCAGQIHDVDVQGHSELPLDEAVAVSVAKSAEGIGGVLRLSALLTDADDAQVEAVGRFGFEFGMALQYCNDLWDLWPAFPQGRLRFGDIRQRKMTPMVVACLSSKNADSEQLAAYYRGRGEPDEKLLPGVAQLIDRCGGRAWARERNHEHMRQALQHLQDASPPPALYGDLATISSHYLA